jgi:hypothetical protein
MNLGAVFQGKALIVCWPSQKAVGFVVTFAKTRRRTELMPQREVLGHDCGPRTKEGDEGPQEKSNQAKHAERIRAENEPEEGRSGGAGTSVD